MLFEVLMLKIDKKLPENKVAKIEKNCDRIDYWKIKMTDNLTV